MRRVDLTDADCLSDSRADALAGTLLDDSSYDRLIRGEGCDVFKPDGSLLLALRPRALPSAACREAYLALRDAAAETDNRGLAAGVFPDGSAKVYPLKRDGTVSKTNTTQKTATKTFYLKKDGTVSRQSRSAVGPKLGSRSRRRGYITAAGDYSDQDRALPVNSGVVGYFDRSARYPYCRQTAFTIARGDRFARALPLLRSVDALFRETVPDRYAAQAAMVARTSPDFVIPGTAFTTVTVNRNWQTAVHKDAGDLKAGFGVMAAFRAGEFDGCYLCFPRFRTAVDLRTRDVLFADVHEYHGNTPLTGVPEAFERLSLVLYYREHMASCGTALEELERAKRRKPGMPLRGDRA